MVPVLGHPLSTKKARTVGKIVKISQTKLKNLRSKKLGSSGSELIKLYTKTKGGVADVNQTAATRYLADPSYFPKMSVFMDRKKFREKIISISKLILPWAYFRIIQKHILRYISSGQPGISVVDLKVFHFLPE